MISHRIDKCTKFDLSLSPLSPKSCSNVVKMTIQQYPKDYLDENHTKHTHLFHEAYTFISMQDRRLQLKAISGHWFYLPDFRHNIFP